MWEKYKEKQLQHKEEKTNTEDAAYKSEHTFYCPKRGVHDTRG
jgi:hypothetical protein